MVGRLNRRQTWLVALALARAWSHPACRCWRRAAAAGVEGVVKDAKGDPVDGATVVLQPAQRAARSRRKPTRRASTSSLVSRQATTRSRPPKADLASVPTRVEDQRRAGPLTSDLVIARQEGGRSRGERGRPEAKAKANAAKVAAFTTAFDAGVAASNAGQHDEAIAKFTEAAGVNADVLRLLQQHRLRRTSRRRTTTRPKRRIMKSNEIKPNAASYSGPGVGLHRAPKKLDQASAARRRPRN